MKPKHNYHIVWYTLRHLKANPLAEKAALPSISLGTIPRSDRVFVASHSRGTKPPCWRGKVALGQDKQRKLPFNIMNAFCLSCPSATLTPQHGDFVLREWLAAKGLLETMVAQFFFWAVGNRNGRNAWAKEKTPNGLLLVEVQLCLTMRIKWHYDWWRKRIG